MADVQVREIVEDDLPAIVELLRELSAQAHTNVGLDLEHARRIHTAMGRDSGLYKNMVAVTDGKIVGFLAMVYYKSFYHQVGTALINELVVSEARRNEGIGKVLVRMAVDMAKADGLDEIEVGTETSNKGAIEFYKKAGFTEEYVLLGKEFTG